MAIRGRQRQRMIWRRGSEWSRLGKAPAPRRVRTKNSTGTLVPAVRILAILFAFSSACAFAQEDDSGGQTAQTPAAIPASKTQPKRILGIMPNYRAVSAGAIPPPPTPKQAFKIATQNSFDYSSFAFVGITSALSEWSDAHPRTGRGDGGLLAVLLARVRG